MTTPTRTTRTWTLALALVLSLLATACGGGDTTADDTTADDTTAGDDTSADAPEDGDGLRIAVLPKSVNNPYFDASFVGAERACEELGATCEYVGPTEATGSAQVEFINTLTQQGVDAIVLSAADADAVTPALQRAAESGITIVTYDADVNDTSARSLFVNPSSPELIGRQQVIWAAEQTGYSGEVAILSAAATADNQNTWIEFMEDELSKEEYSDMTLVDVVYGDDDASLSAERAAGLLQAHPDLAAIISPTTVGIREAANYISGTDFRGEVAVTGLGLPSEMNAFVQDGTVAVFGLWNPQDLGYIAVHAAAQIASGDLTAEPCTSFTAGDADYEITEDNVVIVGPPFAFTADNIDEFDF
ncbi:rhamnose ABC transporter substrate-binding protein [soil metagenome]